jgi:hypothetical protein
MEDSMRGRRGIGTRLLAATLVALIGIAAGRAGAAQAQPIAQPAPAGAARPRAVTDLASAVTQTAAVIEATVAELRNEYREAEGPWTRVVLRDVVVHLGGPGALGGSGGGGPRTLELWQFGGTLPSGRMMVAAELPVFVAGQRYVLFLRNTSWNVSPIVGELALRVEKAAGAEVLVTSAGHPVVGVTAAGPALGAALFEPAPYGGGGVAVKRGADGKEVAVAAGALDRRGFLAAVKTQLAQQKLAVSGATLPRPSGLFQWRGQRVTPHGQGASGDGAAGRDLSGGVR